MTSNRVDSEIDMDWVYPWVGLGWVGSVGQLGRFLPRDAMHPRY